MAMSRVLLFAGLLALCWAAEESAEESTFGSSCIVCKSVDNPKCADSDKLDEFKTSCSSNKPTSGNYQNPVGCRKILQEVEGKNRVVRQCAFSGENVHAFKRTGYEGVRNFYYQCSDKDFCNAATTTLPFLSILLIPLLAALLR